MPLPHPIPYQGSKRRLASLILRLFPNDIQTLYEPFAGSAAVTLAAAARGMAQRYWIGDSLEPLAALWRAILAKPEQVALGYEQHWQRQLDDPRRYYLQARDEFNQTRDPVVLLYLLARCVKNAVRFNAHGDFNQGADHRRLGMKPERMGAAVMGAASLLAGKTNVLAGDYRSLLQKASAQDLVYMDPPYQGVSKKRDPRYADQLDLKGFIEALEELNRRGVPYVISFDGRCGDREYGPPLPDHLELFRMDIDAGRSSQATLNGKTDKTIESLYLSRAVAQACSTRPSTIAVSAQRP